MIASGYQHRRPQLQHNQSDTVAETDEVDLKFYDNTPISQDDLKKSLYIRSAYRHDPSFRDTNIQPQQDVLDRHAVRRLIDTDKTVQNNYQRIIWRLLREVTTPGLMTDNIMADTIGDLQRSMEIVFGDIRLDALVSTQDTGTFTFTKGMSRNFLYEYLSAGEKAAFDLLLDVVANRAAFDDSLYCVDEQEIRAEHAEQVVFLDMGFGPDGEPRDYDQPQTIEPADPDHRFWTRHYAVALDDMAKLLAPDCIVLCEGSTEGDDPSLDESCYNRIFAREFSSTRFVSVGAATKVEKRMGDLLPVLEQIIGGTSIIRFRDRDDLTPEEVEVKHADGVRVMSAYRNIESMLLSDGVLSRLCVGLGRSDCVDAIRTARDTALARGAVQHATDDLKPAAHAVHQAARAELQMPRAGETKHAFMRDVLAPLVAPGTPEYEKLRCNIFGQ